MEAEAEVLVARAVNLQVQVGDLHDQLQRHHLLIQAQLTDHHPTIHQHKVLLMDGTRSLQRVNIIEKFVN